MKAKPLIVASLTDNELNNDILDILIQCDVIELRVDMFDNRGLSDIKRVFNQTLVQYNKPIIGTVRDISEGGVYNFEDKLGVYIGIAEYCSYIDIEISQEPLIKDFQRLYKSNQPKLIASYHNFIQTPDYSELQSLLDRSIILGADITKIAVTPNTKDDVTRLLRFTEKNIDRQIIAISMGDLGRESRITSGLYGSIMTYGYVLKKTAPGQIFISELRREIDLLYQRNKCVRS